MSTPELSCCHCHCVHCLYILPCLTVIVSNVCTISGCLVSLSLCRMCVQSQSVLSHCDDVQCVYTTQSVCVILTVFDVCKIQPSGLTFHFVQCLYISACLVSLLLCPLSTHLSLSGLIIIVSNGYTPQPLWTSLSLCPMSTHLSLSGLTIIVSNVYTPQPVWSLCHCVQCLHTSVCLVSLSLCPISVHLSLSGLSVIVSNVYTPQLVWPHCHCVQCLHTSACLVSPSVCPMSIQLTCLVSLSLHPISVHLSLSGFTVIVSNICTLQPVWSHCCCVHVQCLNDKDNDNAN